MKQNHFKIISAFIDVCLK